jgi:aspartyl protease family protein
MDYNSLTSNDWSNFIYLLILIIVLIISYKNQQDNYNLSTKNIIKYIIIWCVFALISLILYGYRYELIDVKNRVYSILFPSKAVVRNHEQLEISISQDNHFYLVVKINNKSVKFMIDTGASEVVIDKKLAEELGFDLNNLYYDKVFQTANGKVYGSSIFFSEVMVSSIKFYNVSASITNSDLAVPLLGMSFLKRFYKYEFYRDKLILTL